MSSTNRGSTRAPLDYYRTPAWAVHRIMDALLPPALYSLPYFGHWVEPCAGDGAIVRAVNDWIPTVERKVDVLWQACELDQRHAKPLQASLGRDFLGMRIGDTLTWDDPDIHYQASRFDVAMMNPPFRQALQFVEWGVAHSLTTVALLRLGFLETSKRNGWLRANPPDVYVLPNRPSFTGKGTDSCVYAWMVWEHRRIGRQHGEIRVLPDTPRKDRK